MNGGAETGIRTDGINASIENTLFEGTDTNNTFLTALASV